VDHDPVVRAGEFLEGRPQLVPTALPPSLLDAGIVDGALEEEGVGTAFGQEVSASAVGSIWVRGEVPSQATPQFVLVELPFRRAMLQVV
jgi:hypothetical protein